MKSLRVDYRGGRQVGMISRGSGETDDGKQRTRQRDQESEKRETSKCRGGENPQTPPPGDRDEGRDTLGDKPWVVKAKGNVVLGGDRPEQRGDRNFSVT